MVSSLPPVSLPLVLLSPTPTPAAGDDLRSYFQCATVVNRSSLHHVLARSMRQLLVAPLPASLKYLLPGEKEWSIIERELSQGKPVSLSALRRHVNRVLHQETAGEAARQRPQPHRWNDAEGYVTSYRAIIDSPDCPVPYSRVISMSSMHHPFPLPAWWAEHAPGCEVCSRHEAACGGPIQALLDNHLNPCWFADILAWLSGQWRTPLLAIPGPASRPNHPSLMWSPLAMRPEVERMLNWGVLNRRPPTLINPCMSVVKASDVAEQCRVAAALGRPCPSSLPQDVEAINHHILELLGEGLTGVEEVGVLKPIKIRFCVNLSELLNPLTFKWPFSYASVSDLLVLLMGEGWFLAKLDLERFFNQLALHHDDQPLVGVLLPPELLPDELLPECGPEGMAFSSGYAQFGGQDYPALASGVMATASDILTKKGVPNVFLIDDLATAGRTREECQKNLDTAVSLFRRLGLKLQPTKIVAPSQLMEFLGIMIDTVRRILSLSPAKLEAYDINLGLILEADELGELMVRMLESQLGKLSWVCEVLVAGRARLSRIRACIPGGGHYRPSPHTKVSLSPEAKEDLLWWREQLRTCAAQPRSVPFWTDKPPVFCNIFSDASGEIGFGLVVGDQVFQGLWQEDVVGQSSCFKELVPILLAIEILPQEANGHIVVFNTDNLSNVYAINKGSCKSPDLYAILFTITELAAERQLYLIANWIPREKIEFCDGISRHPWFLV